MQRFAKSRFVKLIALSAFAVVGVVTGVASAACSTATSVTSVAQNPGTCGGMVSFTTASSGGWLICTSNDAQGRIVTGAYLSGKQIRYQLGGSDNDCDPGSGESTTKKTVWVHSL